MKFFLVTRISFVSKTEISKQSYPQGYVGVIYRTPWYSLWAVSGTILKSTSHF